MIEIDDLVKIGELAGPHGIKGEISLVSSYEETELSEDMCLICEVDGIAVPFFIDSYRNKGNTVMLVRFSGIDTGEKAKHLSGCSVYIPKEIFNMEEKKHNNGRHDLTGYDIVDENHGLIGKVRAVNDSTMNILLIVAGNNGGELLVPRALVTEIQQDKNIARVILPAGFMEI